MNTKETKKNIILAGHVAVEELIKVAKEVAIFDAFEILNRIVAEQDMLEDKPKEVKKETTFRGFAEGRSK
jgi:hypothetical protein